MQTMKAYVRTDARSQRVVMADVEVGDVGDYDVRVAVGAFGVGVHDRFFIPPTGPFPYTIGVEAAGTVAEAGTGVRGVGVGDRVMVSAAMQPGGGTWAEYVVTPASSVTPVPDALDTATAAGITVAGTAAVNSLHTLDLHEGDTLFVAGASGAIGTLVVQMASSRGIRVMG